MKCVYKTLHIILKAYFKLSYLIAPKLTLISLVKQRVKVLNFSFYIEVRKMKQFLLNLYLKHLTVGNFVINYVLNFYD